MKRIITTLMALFLVAGCASIISKSQYPINIKSVPPGAAFTIRDVRTGEVITAGKTPAVVTLKSSAGYFRPARYLVEYQRNRLTQTIPITATIDGWYFGNLLFGGVIGMLIVDPATGAMWRLDDSVMAVFNQNAQSIKRGHRELIVYSINEIPDAWKSSLVALK